VWRGGGLITRMKEDAPEQTKAQEADHYGQAELAMRGREVCLPLRILVGVDDVKAKGGQRKGGRH
jgi:hypothetical protein